MTFAEVTFDGDMTACVWQAVVFLLFLGGVMFVLCYLMGENHPVASSTSRADRLGPKLASPSAPASETSQPIAPEPLANSDRRYRERRSPKDNRRSLRRGGNPVPVLVADTLGPEKTLPGLVLNRSRGGLCLSVPQPIGVGRVLAVRTHDYPEGLESVQIRVRHCKRKGDGFQLGCQFVEAHPWSVLLIFG